MQNWSKYGLLFDFAKYSDKYVYASVPTGFWITEDVLRIIFSTRNEQNQSIPFFIDFDVLHRKIISEPTKINLELGQLGTFDDSGIMPTSIIEQEAELWLYYIGWNLGVTVPFRNSVGLAKSLDKGKTFKKCFEGPILDRTKEEPHFSASNCVLKDNEIFKIWYLSCVKWKKEDDKITHCYHIKYATSPDGINWERKGKVAIDFLYENEYAISVPRVIKENNIYKMWYSYRGSSRGETYRIGYAESEDGVQWKRRDELVNLDISADGWDSEMICYPFIFNHKGKRYMLYNGNGYGKTGFGIAVLE